LTMLFNKDREVVLFESNDVLLIKRRFLKCLFGQGDEVGEVTKVS